MNTLLAALIAYLIGSINSSILVGKLWHNVDIRQHGSGNAGATNTLRTLGKSAALVVLIGDILKGVISIIIARMLGGDLTVFMAGFACVLGHNFPIYFGFKGGKGILTSTAIIFMIDWKIGLLLLIIGIIIIAVSRYVSLGSVIGSALYPFIVLILHREQVSHIIFAFCIGILAIYRHRANIQRLLQGKESKLGKKQNPSIES